MSKGFHTKISLLARRKLTRALSYLEESVVPMRTTLPSELLGSTRTSLMPSMGSKDPADQGTFPRHHARIAGHTDWADRPAHHLRESIQL